MFYTDIERMLAEKGVTNPTAFLKKAGFTYKAGLRLRSHSIKTIRLNALEKLCLVLRCTPNDVLHWQPDNNSVIPDTHPLHALRPNNEAPIQSYLQKLPMEKLKEVKNFIKNLEP